MSSKVIAITGGSGSGKTTIANMLKSHYADDALLLSLDSYYNDLSHLDNNERSNVNFDHPDSQDISLLHSDILSLKNGNSVYIPEYCFVTHTRKVNKLHESSKPVIILEGLYAYYDKKLADQVDFKVFVDVSPDIRLIRRIRRDMLERGRDVDSILNQYESTVRTMYLEYIDKQKSEADLILLNDGELCLQELLDNIINNLK